ncbi:hypothetical protein FOPG_19726 [Fusarium oxysporum f. sp. conglutinans race 2 54008]|uniref:Uncharacterized protein n=1 Tax=Fusarium oxysporum f. sp. conglutinans race 2 54008 TaxID=1089457 RepID=X0GL14_FUSOX|nr:hypothetical protein FOPG_19726 [Fusarium oxysporum f. sp. conglutinans race 2 54008]
MDDCTAPEQCINCLGPHAAGFRKCPARLRKLHGVFRRLTKAQREHVRAVGAETNRQRHPEPQLEPNKTRLSCKGIILHYMSNRVLVLPA